MKTRGRIAAIVAASVAITLLGSCKEDERKHSERPDSPPPSVVVPGDEDEETPKDPYSETEEELQAILSNPSTRFFYKKLTLELSTPGTLVDVSNDEKTIRLVSLDTGQEVKIAVAQPLFAPRQKVENELIDVSLWVNSAPVALSAAWIYTEGSTRWVKLITADGPHAWLVISEF